MTEGDIDGSVTVLYIEDHGVTAGLMPATDELNALGAAGGRSRQVDRAHLAIFRERPTLLDDRLRLHAGYHRGFAALEDGFPAVGLADFFLELWNRHVGRLGQVLPRQKRCCRRGLGGVGNR